MKIATIIVRSLVGLLFIFASVAYFAQLFPQPVLTGNMKVFNDGLTAAVYLMPFIKTTELVCGIAFLSGRFTALASVVIFPITINIFFVHAFLAPEGLAVGIALLLANLFLAYVNRAKYEGLWSSN
jgi:putative oxidoreductase